METMSGYRTKAIPTRGEAEAPRTPRSWAWSIAVSNVALETMIAPPSEPTFGATYRDLEHGNQGLLQQCMSGLRCGNRGSAKADGACSIRDVEWIDVLAQPEAVERIGSPLEQVRKRLHVKAANSPLEVGADAFTRLWLQTPGQRWLGKLLRLPVFKQITHVVYNAFARLLYLWNRAKDIGKVASASLADLPCRCFLSQPRSRLLRLLCTRPICGLS